MHQPAFFHNFRTHPIIYFNVSLIKNSWESVGLSGHSKLNLNIIHDINKPNYWHEALILYLEVKMNCESQINFIVVEFMVKFIWKHNLPFGLYGTFKMSHGRLSLWCSKGKKIYLLKTPKLKGREVSQTGFWNASLHPTSVPSLIQNGWPHFLATGTLSQTMTLKFSRRLEVYIYCFAKGGIEFAETGSSLLFQIFTSEVYLYCRLYNRPSYSRILMSSCLWSIRGQTHDWRHHYKVFSSVF